MTLEKYLHTSPYLVLMTVRKRSLKTLWEKEKMLVSGFPPFPTFSAYTKDKFNCLTFELSSAKINAFILDMSALNFVSWV